MVITRVEAHSKKDEHAMWEYDHIDRSFTRDISVHDNIQLRRLVERSASPGSTSWTSPAGPGTGSSCCWPSPWM